MTMNVLLATLTACLMASSSAFSTNKRAAVAGTKRFIPVMAWGSNLKLGQSVITPEAPETVTRDPITPTPISDVESQSGSSVIQDPFSDTTLITKIDMSLKQKALLMALTNSAVSETVKMDRLHLAASNGVLPSSFRESAVTASSLSSGGLMKDWDFQLM